MLQGSFVKIIATKIGKPFIVSMSWVFTDESGERLRFEIDPSWYGELPRTLFFDREHNRHSVSGLLKREQVEQWLQQQTQ